MVPARARGRLTRVLPRLLGGWADDLSVATNPYAVRDLRSRVRGLRFPVLLLVYHGIVIGIGLIAVAVYVRRSSDEMPAGRSIFPYLVYTQLVLAPIVSAVLTAASVTSERERQTFDLVQLTPLRGVEIALGKLAVPWGLTMLVAVTSAPYAVLCMVGGGVEVTSVLQLYVGLAVFCGITATFGLLMSTVSRSSPAAIIATLVAYMSCLFAGLAANAMLATASLGVMPGAGWGGAPPWTSGPYMYLFPTTWGMGMLSSTQAVCQAFARPIPFWVPGVVIWGLLGAYMTLVAGCRLGLTRPRHFIARRLLGLLCWAVVLGAIHAGVMPGLMAGPHVGAMWSGANVLLMLGVLAAAGGAIAAMQAGVVDCPDLWRRPLSRVTARMLSFWRVLKPEPESGLALGLLVWAMAAAMPFVGSWLISGMAVPRGLSSSYLMALYLPQGLTVLYAALVSIWANARYPAAPNPRRNAAGGRVVPLIAWPLVVLALAAMIYGPLSFRNIQAAGTLVTIALYAAALSPLSHPVLLHTSTMVSASASAWIDVGPVSIHPHMLAMAVALGLCVAAAIAVVGRWRANAEWLESQGYRRSAPSDHGAAGE